MIGGNTKAVLRQISGTTANAIGEAIPQWSDVLTLTGFLDLSGGESKYSTYDTKLQESTHVFICDFVEIDRRPHNKRLVVNGTEYDVLLIDDPMELHRHLEIMLKLVG